LFKKISFSIFLLLICIRSTVWAVHADAETRSYFTENKGQWNNNVVYAGNVDGGKIWFEKNAITYSFYDKQALRNNHLNKNNSSFSKIQEYAYRMRFLHSNQQVKMKAEGKSAHYSNYFIGSDMTKHATGVHDYTKLFYQDLYPGIDMELESASNSFKYTFYVAAHTTQLPMMRYDSVRKIEIRNKDLIVHTSLNEVIEQRPYAYQMIKGKKVEVACEYQLTGNTVSFIFPHSYQSNEALIIDPQLIFSSYSGSTTDNFGMSASYDTQGNLISGGICFNIGYPTTLGAYDPTFNGLSQSGRTDVVLSKYNSSGGNLLFSTYFGGATGTEIISSIVLDANDEVYFLGTTGSADLPVNAAAYDTSFNGGYPDSLMANGTIYRQGTDLYVAHLNASGTQLIGSSYIGGTSNDGMNHSSTLVYNYGDFYRGEIQLDANSNVVVTSCSYSSNFPVTNGVVQNIAGGGLDAVVFSLSSNMQNLLWSTYMGGLADDAGYALCIDQIGNIIFTGGTSSSNFTSTSGVVNSSYQGGISDGYVCKINSNASSVLASTFIGTNDYDQCFFVQTDISNDIYFIGQSAGSMPVQNVQYSNPGSGHFVQKLNSNLSQVIYSTVFGNGSGIRLCPSAFLVDKCQNVYVSGWGGNILTGVAMNGMPVTTNAQQSTTDGYNFYLIVFDANISALNYATYFGGNLSLEHVDGGTSRFDKNGIIYQSVCAGCGSNSDFPTTPGAWSATNNSFNCNNAVFKIDFQVPLGSAFFKTDTIGCYPLSFIPQQMFVGNSSFYWSVNNVIVDSINLQHQFNFDSAGTYTIKLKVDNVICNFFDSLIKIIKVYPPPIADFSYVEVPCSTGIVFTDSSSTVALPFVYDWNFGDGTNSNLASPQHVYDSLKTYTVRLVVKDAHQCVDTFSLPINIDTLYSFTINENIGICAPGLPVQLLASGADYYQWNPASLLNNASIANPIATVLNDTIFTVTLGIINTSGDTCSRSLTTNVYISELDSNLMSVLANPDTIFSGDTTQLSVNLLGATQFKWTPAELVTKSNNNVTPAMPQADTWFEARANDSLGCSVSKKVFVKVLSNACDEPYIFIPNSFTPNDDGKNDFFMVNGNYIESLTIKIYDRWGKLVFESSNQSIGWNGLINGVRADAGVYGYYAEAKCFDGKTFFKKGNITLIR
jgi:gliding motility-associated-like protein